MPTGFLTVYLQPMTAKITIRIAVVVDEQEYCVQYVHVKDVETQFLIWADQLSDPM